jgi:exosortase B
MTGSMSPPLKAPGAVAAPLRLLPWYLLAAGLGVLYVPSFIDLFNGAWSSEKNAHGPIVMTVAFVFLYFRLRQVLSAGQFERVPAPVTGGAMLAVGLLMYVLGRSQSVQILEVGSLLLVLSGLLVAFFGVRTWSRMWFAFFFMFFMIPLPPSIVDMLTLPMKIGVSYATEHLLYWMGYPISRSGVILTIGPYQLLVADACAGLNSLFTLEALGLLYMNLVRHPSLLRNAVLATLIIPISFTANTIRIVFLSLITFYLGDAAGQGFLHGFSGLVLFLSALMLIISVDGLLSWIVAKRVDGKRVKTEGAGLQLPPMGPGAWRRLTDGVALRPAAVFLAFAVAGVGMAHALAPTITPPPASLALEQAVPQQFGQWRMLPDAAAQATLATNDEGGALTDQIYDEVVMRTYVNAEGTQVMLALAYAKEQRQDVKLHLPEICYPAQGYKVSSLTPASLAVGAGGAALPGKHMLASGNGRTEAVTYWTRVGDGYPNAGLAMRTKIFRDGLGGKISDGMLVRSSIVVRDASEAPAAYATQQAFLRELVASVKPGARALVAPAP